jgi:NAD(P)H dehydrogenase (quinone)
MASDILVLFYSRHGTTAELAQEVAAGIDRTHGAAARVRTVPAVSATTSATEDAIPDSGPPYAEPDDLRDCAGLVLGSPTHFGNMPAAMKHFWDGTTELWLAGALVDKPAGLFTSTGSLHGGQESTLLTMMVPLLHHGMVIAGLPYVEADLTRTRTGGTPYGASHVSFNRGPGDSLSDEERRLAAALGARIASLALRLDDR